MGKILPYCVTLSNISRYFEKIKQAEVPNKFDHAFLRNVLGFKSGNDRALITLLKKMEFLDATGIPLQRYKDFRVQKTSGKAMAEGIKKAYPEILQRDVNAGSLDENTIKEFVKGITELQENNSVIRLITKTFLELSKLADFAQEEKLENMEELKISPEHIKVGKSRGEIQFTYTIVLNLPSTTTQEIYDALFRSLKKNLLED